MQQRTRSPSRSRVRAFVLAAALAGLTGAVPAAAPAPAWANDAEPKKSVDCDAVYCGDAREWSKPAEVDPDTVYGSIDEYKEIVEKKLQPGDAKYGVLMSKARKRFLGAVRAAAKDGGYDLVAKVGAVKGAGTVPVITRDVIAKL